MIHRSPEISRSDIRNFLSGTRSGTPGGGKRGATLFRFSELVAIASLAPFAATINSMRPRGSNLRPWEVRELWTSVVINGLQITQPDADKPLWLVVGRGAPIGHRNSMATGTTFAEAKTSLEAKMRAHASVLIVDLAQARRSAAALVQLEGVA